MRCLPILLAGCALLLGTPDRIHAAQETPPAVDHDRAATPETAVPLSPGSVSSGQPAAVLPAPTAGADRSFHLSEETVQRLQLLVDARDRAKGDLLVDDPDGTVELPGGALLSRVPVKLWSTAVVQVGADGSLLTSCIENGTQAAAPDTPALAPPPTLATAAE